MWRNARVSCTTSMRIMSQRLPMISRSRFLLVGCAAAALLSSAGCRYLHQDMADQPKNRPLSPSDFFPDGRSERPPVEKDRKSTRLNSSHGYISYAVFCLKKKIAQAQERAVAVFLQRPVIADGRLIAYRLSYLLPLANERADYLSHQSLGHPLHVSLRVLI